MGGLHCIGLPFVAGKLIGAMLYNFVHILIILNDFTCDAGSGL